MQLLHNKPTYLYSILLLFFLAGLFISIKMNPHSLPCLIAAYGNIFLTIFVFYKGRQNSLNRAYALWGIASAFYCFDIWGFYVAPTAQFAAYWARIFRQGFIFAAPLFYNFTLQLVKNKEKRKKVYLFVGYAIAAVFMLLNVSGHFQDHFVKVDWKYSPVPGAVYTFHLVFLVFYALLALIEIFRGSRKTDSSIIRNQLRYVLLAGLVALVISFTNIFLSLGIKIYPFGSLGYIVFSGIIAYAIVKHRLMEIDIIIGKGIVYASLTVSILTIYAVIVGAAQLVFGASQFFGASLLANAFAAMIIAVSFLPVRNKAQQVVDKLFFKDRYDYQITLRSFSREISALVGLEKLLNMLVMQVTEIMHIDKGFIMLLDAEKNLFEIRYRSGISADLPSDPRMQIEGSHEAARLLVEQKAIVVVDEYDGEVSYFRHLAEQGYRLCVPLVVRNKLVAIFVLGRKMSEDTYTSDDIGLLTTVANQAAIAIENAKLSESMRSLEKSLHQMDKLSALGTFASSIAHEIKNPLASIKTFCQLVSQKFGDARFVDKFKTVVPAEIERLEYVLGQLLDFGKFSELHLNPVRIDAVIDDLLVLLHYEAFNHNVRIVKQYTDDIPPVMAAEEQLKQVFMNLILNAIQAMPHGGELRIAASRTNHGASPESVKIEFQDTGQGIPAEIMNNLFKPFFTTKPNGTGLGLSITHKIIREHGGTVGVQSEIGKGTVFTIVLPIDNNIN